MGEWRECPLQLFLPDHAYWAIPAVDEGQLEHVPWSGRSRSYASTGLWWLQAAINRISPLWRCWV
jgi:hypothetical protein